MDSEIVTYILRYFSRLMTPQEVAASRHSDAMMKLGTKENYPDIRKYDEKYRWFKHRKMITEDREALSLLNEGREQFNIRVAERIMEETPDQVFFNCCPQCSRLARTVQARQCRYCGYSWHHTIKAQFKIEQVVIAKGDPGKLSFSGILQTGKIESGMKMDLTTLGIADKPVIESVHDNVFDPYNGPNLVLSVALEPDLHAYVVKSAPDRTVIIEQ